jgi:hypothetical protein
LRERNLLPAAKRSPVTGSCFFYRDRIRRTPPRSFLSFLRLRGKEAPVDESFRARVTSLAGAETADLGLKRRLGDPFVVSDLEFGGWLGTYSKADKTLAPEGHHLVQGHMPIKPEESVEDGIAMLETVADAAYRGWSDRTMWRRQQLMNGQVGAVDLPGRTWRDRPQIDQGNGVFLAGDWVAAPGLLSEVAFSSAVTAAQAAMNLLRGQPAGRGATPARHG